MREAGRCDGDEANRGEQASGSESRKKGHKGIVKEFGAAQKSERRKVIGLTTEV